MKELIQKGEIE